MGCVALLLYNVIVDKSGIISKLLASGSAGDPLFNLF